MNIKEIIDKILTDDDFLLAEVKKIQYLYKLKKEIRYGLKRNEVLESESVAEHIYGMHIIANYFLPLIDPDNKMNKEKVFEMITWHDVDEIVTGDTITYQKTSDHQVNSEKAIAEVILNLPTHIKSHISSLIEEYEKRQTPESRFVKAIDKAEPFFEVFQDHYFEVFHKNNQTMANHWQRRREYLIEFPIILRFGEVITENLDQRGFYVK